MRAEKGLSLLEVLIAFAILGIVLTALLRVFGTGLRNSALADAKSQAALRAESVLASVAAEPVLRPGETEGDYGDGYQWRRTIRLYNDQQLGPEAATLPVVPMEIIAEVSWGGVFRPDKLRLATLRLAPRELENNPTHKN
jgi:general secretion pathway protein I